jgi:hypothetical protein
MVINLKRNFSSESSIVVWGKGDLSNCIEPLNIYLTDTAFLGTNTLYMLIKSIVLDDVPYSDRKKGDYTTIDCACSVISVDRTERKFGNRDIVRVNDEWITSGEFEEKFGVINTLKSKNP